MASNDGSRPEPQKPVDGQSTEIMSPQSMGDVAKPENPTKPISPVTSSAGPVPDASAEPSRESTTQLHAPNAYADWNALKETPTTTMPQVGQPMPANNGTGLNPTEVGQRPTVYAPVPNAAQNPKPAEPKTKKPIIAIVFAVIYLFLALISDGAATSVSIIIVFAILPALFSGLAFLDTREKPKSKKRIYAYIAIAITVLSIVVMGGKMIAYDMHEKALEKETETSISSDSSKSDDDADEDSDSSSKKDERQSQDSQQNQGDTQSQQQSEQKDSSQVDPNFKATMDSYEQFFDQYVAFMQKYKDSNYSADMLVDYTKMMQQYSDTMTKMDSIDQGSLSAADDAYYVEVLGRISQKLAVVQ